MFLRMSNGHKPVDLFLANLKTVDMLLTTIMRTGRENDYLFHFLVPHRISRETHPGQFVIAALPAGNNLYTENRCQRLVNASKYMIDRQKEHV